MIFMLQIVPFASPEIIPNTLLNYTKRKGPTEIWAKTEIKSSVKINVQFGQEYYLKSSITTGIMGGRPELNQIYLEQGKLDFENVRGEKLKSQIISNEEKLGELSQL